MTKDPLPMALWSTKIFHDLRLYWGNHFNDFVFANIFGAAHDVILSSSQQILSTANCLCVLLYSEVAFFLNDINLPPSKKLHFAYLRKLLEVICIYKNISAHYSSWTTAP